jgi:hypothetical protein
LLARSYRPGQTVLLKEWPLANYIIPEILAVDGASKAVFAYSSLEDYVNAVFRRKWRAEILRQRVLNDLCETDRWPFIHERKETFTDGQLAAAHWFVQQQAFLGLDPALADRIRSVHSSAIFHDPCQTALRVARHFGLDPSGAELARLHAATTVWHAKAPGVPYSLARREEEIRETSARYGQQIEEALAQLEAWNRQAVIPARLPWPLEAS